MKKKFLAILQALGFDTKDKTQKLTKAESDKIDAKCQEDLQLTLTEVLEKIKAEEQSSTVDTSLLEQIGAVFSSENVVENNNDDDDDDDEDDKGGNVTAENLTPEAVMAQINGLVATNKTLKTKLEKIEKEMDKKDPVATLKGDTKKILLCGPGTNKTHLFGIQDALFELKKPWNAMAVTGKPTDTNDPAYKEALYAEFAAYSRSLQERVDFLHNNKQMQAMLSGNLDYTDLESEFGAVYRVRRQDAIITHVKKLRSIAGMFPVRYGVQDKQDMVQAFQGKSFTQAYQAGRVFAGSFAFQPQSASVKKVMFKYQFTDLKDLENEYIGYLNKEGSDPMKWSFIEWIMIECAKIQHNEKEKRRVKGWRVEPTAGSAQHFMYGSDGVLTTLEKQYEHENRIYVFNQFRAYSSSTILTIVEAFAEAVFQLKDNFDDFVLCMNEKHVPWYKAAYRTAYGTDMDYKGNEFDVKDYNISPDRIYRVPNMGMRYDMWFMPKGAIEILENKPSEFFSYYFERTLEELVVAAYGAEGTFAFGGKKYATRAALLADNGEFTNIFRNNPTTQLADGATTCNAALNEMFETVANSGATNITDITSAKEGVAYKILCGATANASTVTKDAKFSTITANWTPTAVGDYLRVIYDPTAGKFHEIDRKVAGVVAINTALTSPVLA